MDVINKTSLSKAWSLTIPNWTEEDHEAALLIPCQYGRVAKEVGEGGLRHLQCMFQFKKQFRLSGVRKIFRGHWEPARSKEALLKYCSKDGDYVNIGTPPATQGSGNKMRWDLAKQAAKENRIDDVPDELFIKYYSTMKRIAKDYMVKPQELPFPYCGTWIYGKSGAGKSHAVARAYPDRYIKPRSKGWDGYQGEDVVHLDEINPDHTAWISAFLKDWGHQYPFHAETKGGAFQIRPKKFIISSNYSIDEMGFKENDVEPIKLRFKEILKVREQDILLL